MKIKSMDKILNSVKILGLDLSFRETGAAVISRSRMIRNSNTMVRFQCLVWEEITTYKHWTHEVSYLFLRDRLWDLIDIHKADHVIIEVPDRSQSAQAALMAGYVQALAFEIIQDIGRKKCEIVKMEHLKKWSGSKRGDKKVKVKEKVCQTFEFLKTCNNDNIIDAMGLCLSKCDQLSIKEHETPWK